MSLLAPFPSAPTSCGDLLGVGDLPRWVRETVSGFSLVSNLYVGSSDARSITVAEAERHQQIGSARRGDQDYESRDDRRRWSHGDR